MNPTPVTYNPPLDLIRLGKILAGVGGLTMLIGLLIAPARTCANVLLDSYLLLGLGLGSLALVALQYATGAGWGVAVRRLPEALAALIPVASVGVLVVLLFYPSLYPWTGSAAEDAHPGAGFRHLWLNRPFFLIRAGAYVAVWVYFYRAIVRESTQQDEDGQVSHTLTNQRLSAAFLVVYGITCWLSSVDWIMSLEPEWSSTIFGVYHFSGQFLGGIAVVTLLAIWLTWQGSLRGILTLDHLHDLGKLLFSFCSFWMYIWFAQYLLIWYVNNPEETSYYIRRVQGGWWPLFLLNVLISWVVPFLVLMPRATKRSPRVMLGLALLVLAGRWLDLYIMILPPLGGEPFRGFGLLEAGLAIGTVGIFMTTVFRALGERSLVPVQDPFLIESLPHATGNGHHRLTSAQGGELLATGPGSRHPETGVPGGSWRDDHSASPN